MPAPDLAANRFVNLIHGVAVDFVFGAGFMMKKSIVFLLALAACLSANAQNWTTVAAANITDLNQQKLAAGQLCFLATDQNDNPISIGIGGGGQLLRRAFCATVSNGAVSGLSVPNPAATAPAGVMYRVTVNDTSVGKEVLRYSQVAFAGATFNFDAYAPTGAGPLPPIGSTVNGNLNVNGNLSITGSFATSQFGNISATAYNNVVEADTQAGSDACAQIAAAIAALPATGGTVDARGLQGAQSCAANPFASQTAPITLLLGATTITTSATWAPKSSGGTAIYGLDAAQTIIKAATNLNARVIDMNGFNNLTVANFQVDGNKANQSASSLVDGIHFLNTSTIRCSNVLVQNTKNHGYWFENNFSDVDLNNCSANAPNLGSGVLMGNGGVGFSGSHIKIRGGFFNNSQIGNGIFSVGSITDLKISGCEARQNADTDIEIGDGTVGFVVSGCSIDVASTGILLRSSQAGTVTGNRVTTSIPVAGQIGIYHWNNTGDSQPFKNITTEGNTICGLTTGGIGASGNVATDIAWSSVSGSSGNIQIMGNTTCPGDVARYGAFTTNVAPLVLDRDDGIYSNNANDLTLQAKSSGFIHVVSSGLGVSSVSFTPASVLHTQTGGGINDLTIECTADANCGLHVKNSVQDWSWAIRSASSESIIMRNITNSTDPFTYSTGGNFTATGTVAGKAFATSTNCSSTGGTCGSSAAGSIGITNPATTVTVSTSAVTANSQIFIQEDSSLGTKLGVTCNTTGGRTYMVSSRTAGTGFVITASVTPTANTACLSYFIVN